MKFNGRVKTSLLISPEHGELGTNAAKAATCRLHIEIHGIIYKNLTLFNRFSGTMFLGNIYNVKR